MTFFQWHQRVTDQWLECLKASCLALQRASGSCADRESGEEAIML